MILSVEFIMFSRFCFFKYDKYKKSTISNTKSTSNNIHYEPKSTFFLLQPAYINVHSDNQPEISYPPTPSLTFRELHGLASLVGGDEPLAGGVGGLREVPCGGVPLAVRVLVDEAPVAVLVTVGVDVVHLPHQVVVGAVLPRAKAHQLLLCKGGWAVKWAAGGEGGRGAKGEGEGADKSDGGQGGRVRGSGRLRVKGDGW